ncbi:MAG: hypothetical protein ACREJ6_07770, partial [Candidatus Methylomirabilis sp.]
ALLKLNATALAAHLGIAVILVVLSVVFRPRRAIIRQARPMSHRVPAKNLAAARGGHQLWSN